VLINIRKLGVWLNIEGGEKGNKRGERKAAKNASKKLKRLDRNQTELQMPSQLKIHRKERKIL